MKEKPDGYMKWLHGLHEEDRDMGYGYIKRTHEQLKQLYRMYLDSFNENY